MSDGPDERYLRAVQHFQEARQRADLELISARLTGKSADLIPFEEVRRRLKGGADSERRERRRIPLDSIVGSVGRYSDFTRTFLPRHESDRARWTSMREAFLSHKPLPPIDVFQVGDVYFVVDGNHRVSVARSLGMDDIDASVTPVTTRLPLTPDVRADDLLLMGEYDDFLERTGLDESCPDANFTMSAPGRYADLLDLIEVHCYRMAEAEGREVALQEAAQVWCEEVYHPLVTLIRERGILRNFPGRTEADLCVWLARHHERLADELGWEVPAADAASDFVARYSRHPRGVARRLRDRIRGAVVPPPLEAGPPAGNWRTGRAESETLFREILVPVSGEEEGWRALEQALLIAAREQGQLHGLRVLNEAADEATEARLRAEFEARCERAGISGTFHTRQGGAIAAVIRELGEWSDLMVLRLAYPPGAQPVERLRSGFSHLIRSASRPLLAVPGEVSALSRPLLAYDGSPKAREALYVATYVAGRWQLPLTVVTISDGSASPAADDARAYLEEQGIEAEVLTLRRGTLSAGHQILELAWARQHDFIIMGGYGYAPVLEIALGSTVDTVLRHSVAPVLVCR